MKSKRTLVTYVLLYIASGLMYSMTTSKIIDYQLGNKFYILFTDAIVNIVIFAIISLHLNRNIKPTSLVIFSIFVSLAFSLYMKNSLISVTLFYFLLTLIIDFDLIDSENRIVLLNRDDGMRNISFFKNFSQIIGFFVGSFIPDINNIFLAVLFIFLFSLKYFESIRESQSSTLISEQKSSQKVYRLHWDISWFFLIFLSSTTVFWIPIFIAKLNLLHQNSLYFIPFVLPGIISIIMLRLFAKASKPVITFLYLLGLILFIFSLNQNVWIPIVIFSILVGFNVVINMWLRNNILLKHSNQENFIVLQCFELVNCVILLIFSALALLTEYIPYYLLFFDFIGALGLLLHGWRKKMTKTKVGICYRPWLHNDFLNKIAENVDSIEVMPDATQLEDIRQIKNIATQHNLSIATHCLRSSLAQVCGYQSENIKNYFLCNEFLNSCYYSDHLAYSYIGDTYLSTVQPIKFTYKNLKLVANNLEKLSKNIPGKILIENIVQDTLFKENELTEAEFFNELMKCTPRNVRLLFDLTNMVVTAHNNNYSFENYIHQYPFDSVESIHVSGYTEKDRLFVDSHNVDINMNQARKLAIILNKSNAKHLYVERDFNVTSFSDVARDLNLLQNIVKDTSITTLDSLT